MYLFLSLKGRRILDSGLNITWGDGNHWREVDEPTSPRGRIWHLNQVCWLSVRATVPNPPPGCYAAFFRVRQPTRMGPLLRFSAEWKAVATTSVSACTMQITVYISGVQQHCMHLGHVQLRSRGRNNLREEAPGAVTYVPGLGPIAVVTLLLAVGSSVCKTVTSPARAPCSRSGGFEGCPDQ